MLLLVGMIVVTGIMMTRGVEAAEDIHGVLAYALLAIAVVHVLGVIWYSIRHRENISRSMITGFKLGRSEDAIRSSRPYIATAFVGFIAFFTIGLFYNYEPSKRQTRIPIMNTAIQLSESH
jgi:hypothetical protein